MEPEKNGAISQKKDLGDSSTAVAAAETKTAQSSRAPLRLPTLTLLAHPDLGRIGERVILHEFATGRPVLLGRTEPRFTQPAGGLATALQDRFLSRRPITLRAEPDGGVLLERGKSSTPVEVDSEALLDHLKVSSRRIEGGVVMVLADRIALLLHQGSVDPLPVPPSYGLLGESEAMVEFRRALSRVADVDVPVLIRGATGSGKELAAKALHAHGPRPGGPFVAVNLGALTPSLAAAELFGARKGAFTGAVRDQPGHFVRAHGGTLFLDEIGEAPAELQVMLLRTLETGEVFPVGSQSPRRPELRLVSATDAPLESLVEKGDFRAPLLHRLSGYRLHMPSLSDRRDDIGRLLIHFLKEERRRVGEPELNPDPAAARPWMDPTLMARLVRHDWPGNVRELRNVARELVIDSRARENLVVSSHLDQRLPAWGPSSQTPALQPVEAPRPHRRRKPSQVTEEELLAALRENRFDLKATAHALGVSRTGLYARIDRSPHVRTAAEISGEEIRRAHQEHGEDLKAMVTALEVSERALRQRLKDLGLR